MISSMTGYGRARRDILPWGRVSFEIRSVNHRFYDVVLHLPEGFLYLEQRFKDEIGKKIKRGHVVCRLELNSNDLKKPVLNKRMIKEYYSALKKLSSELNLKQDIKISALMDLPGVWAMQSRPASSVSWPQIRPLVREALDKAVKGRKQEGAALYRDLINRTNKASAVLKAVKARFAKVIKKRLTLCNNDADKNSFLKSSDINEELVRLNFHVKNFAKCLSSNKSIGKELDFILQEMQREANTVGAKSIDALISDKTVKVKSEIEKMREQVQNVE
ncbi:MAG: YicC family protein [Candidatus Omnitrophica bacterium]|nr:YicC family protein [Candidatus Omnitrophota bacterium]